MIFTRTITVLMFCAVAAPAIAQDANRTLGATIKATVAVVAKHHLRKPAIDEAFCERWLDKYLETLDPGKLYFLSDDIAEFETYLAKLPEFATTGDTEFLNLVSKRYQLRAQPALAYALTRIDQPFDFSIDETLSLEYERWPTTEEERIERWRLRLKYDLLIERSRSNSPKEQIRFLKSRYDSIREQAEELPHDQALGLYLDSLCQTIDPHSNYLTQREFDSFVGGMLKEHSIGLSINRTKGRAMIMGVAPEFREEPVASQLIDCELLAIGAQNGDIYNCREILPSTISQLVRFGLSQDKSVTLELYDESAERRFAINWPRK